MTSQEQPSSAEQTPAVASDASSPPSNRRRIRLTVAATATAFAGVAISVAYAGAAGAAAQAPATTKVNCIATPTACGFPDATTAGVPAGTVLKAVPSQVSSGPGWVFSQSAGAVEVTGNGAVLSGLRIPYAVDISASNVTIRDVQVITTGTFGVSLRHTAGFTIENSTVSGLNATTGRLDYGIDDVYGDSTAMIIKADNIFDFRTGVQVTTGLITGNYIHDPGYVAGDHTNGIYVAGSIKPLTISGNTILNSLRQTDDINLDATGPGQAVANKIIEGNLLAGGGYDIYAGFTLGAGTSGIVITGNRFSQIYFPHAGFYGPVTYFNPLASGNAWAANVWDATGLATSAP